MIKLSIGISTIKSNKGRAIKLAESIIGNDTNNFITTVGIVSQGEEFNREIVSSTKIRLFESVNKGLSLSRNNLLELLSGDYIWLIDDDVVITELLLDTVYNTCKKNSTCDLIIGKIYCSDKDEYFKKYNRVRTGYNGVLGVSSIEMIINKEFLVSNQLKYNPLLGLGAIYPCGEENELLIKCLNSKANIYFTDEVFIMHPSTESLNRKDYFSTKEQLFAKKIIANILPFKYKITYLLKVIVYLIFYKKNLSLLLEFLKPYKKGL